MFFVLFFCLHLQGNRIYQRYDDILEFINMNTWLYSDHNPNCFYCFAQVECYDPKTDAWTFVAAMCAHGGGVGVGVIPLS